MKQRQSSWMALAAAVSTAALVGCSATGGSDSADANKGSEYELVKGTSKN